jgi:excisionase family DNA binding protein
MPRDLVYPFDGKFIYRAPSKPPSPEPAEQQSVATITPATLSPEELAKYLGCGRSHAYKLLRYGEIPSFKLGRLRKVLRSDAEEYLARLRGPFKGAR